MKKRNRQLSVVLLEIRIVLLKAHFRRQTVARSQPNKTLFRGQHNIDTPVLGNKTSYLETLKITTD
jgi:hypothetical protein